MARFNSWSPDELTPEALLARSEKIRRSAELILLVQKPYVFMEEDYFGLVENSFSMSIEENRAFVYWSSDRMEINARQWAERDRVGHQAKHPSWKFTIWSVTDLNLPVVLNWELWLDGHAPSNDTLAGVKNKHEARNIRFYPKGQQPPRWWATTTVRGLVPMVNNFQFPQPVSIDTAIATVQLHDHEQARYKAEP